MAQTGYTPISLYYSTTAAATPSAGNLANGELAINITDGKLFYKDNGGNVQVIGTKGGVGSSSTTQVLYNSSGLVVGSANLTFDGTKLSVGNLLNAGLTASKPVFTDASKNLVSTGTLLTDQGGTGLTSWTTGDIPYFSAGTSLSKLAIGGGSTVLTSSGSAPQWTSLASLSIGTATNLAGGAAGSLPYQTAPGTTTFLSIGTASQVLRVNSGATALEYVNQSALSVGSATTATTSTNIAGGSAGAIAYNSASGTTTFLGIGSASQVLQVNSGATAPEWVSSTGTGNVVRATSPTLVTPTLGAATATTINKLTITAPASSATLTIADGKTFAANATLTLAGTDGTTMTMPASSTTLAGLGIAQTFTQDQTIAANLTLNAQGDLRFGDSDSSNWVAFQAPATVASNVTWTLPSADGMSGQFLSTNGSGTLSWSSVSGTGDVVGPASATDNAVVRFDGTTGKLIQNSAVTIADTTGDITGGKYNNVTITSPVSTATLTLGSGKTVTINNTLTFSGTDATTMTFPSTSTTVAGLGVAQTFTQDQTISGNLTLNGQGDVRFADSDSSNWVAFQAPATIASNVTWTLPNADGNTGQVLSTNGSGTLSWATASGGSSVILENQQTISSNYTVTDGNNGLSVGPVTISTNVTVTVGTGEKWVVLEF